MSAVESPDPGLKDAAPNIKISSPARLSEASGPEDKDDIPVQPPPSSRSSTNGDSGSALVSAKAMRELLLAKLSAIAEEVDSSSSPPTTMMKALDDSCVMFAVGRESSDVLARSPSEGPSRPYVWAGVHTGSRARRRLESSPSVLHRAT